MDLSRSPRFSSWVLSIVLHGALLLCVALAIGSRESKIDHSADVPDFRCSLTAKGPFIGFERTPDCYARWPRKCAHSSLRRDLAASEGFVWDAAPCTLCGKSWWEIQEAIWD